MILYIKNMVSLRCKMMVRSELEKLGIQYVIISLGEVEVSENISQDELKHLKASLQQSGLELIENSHEILTEKIKNTIVELIHYSNDISKVNYSDYLVKKLGLNYTYMANTFCATKGITVQQFIINQKIEKVKELLIYNELNLTEIAYELHYSSVAHLSNQFKKNTGYTPTFYRQLEKKQKENLENI